MKLNIGPGPSARYFQQYSDWELIDAEPSRSSKGLKMDFNVFNKIDRPNEYYSRVYASHVLEHVHPAHTRRFLKEINRVMKPTGVFRIIIPDARKSIEQYLSGTKFRLFEERKKKHGRSLTPPMTDFEAMRMCFVSLTRQPVLTKGKDYIPFAHQNAWDFESIRADLIRSGFRADKIVKSSYEKSCVPDFHFETKLGTEARKFDRSLYIEVVKWLSMLILMRRFVLLHHPVNTKKQRHLNRTFKK